jgi:hypothetical protein
MDGKTQNGMQCIEFEALLADALDGTLEAPRMAAFQAHAHGCLDCGPLLAQARAGLAWMKSLQEIEPPRNLVHNILAATTGREAAEERAAARRSWKQWFGDWIRPVLVPAWTTVRQPRFAMSFGMAFFSLSLVLNVTGLKLRDLRYLDLRPSAIQSSATRGYYETQARVVKYYENMRLVYELQSRVRDLRNATRSDDQQQQQQQPPQQRKEKNRDNDTSGQPERRNQYYSADQPGVLLAVLRDPDSNQLFPALEVREPRPGGSGLDSSHDRRGA